MCLSCGYNSKSPYLIRQGHFSVWVSICFMYCKMLYSCIKQELEMKMLIQHREKHVSKQETWWYVIIGRLSRLRSWCLPLYIWICITQWFYTGREIEELWRNPVLSKIEISTETSKGVFFPVWPLINVMKGWRSYANVKLEFSAQFSPLQKSSFSNAGVSSDTVFKPSLELPTHYPAGL